MQKVGHKLNGRRKEEDRRRIDGVTYTGIEKRVHTDRRLGVDQRCYPRFRCKGMVLIKMGSAMNENTGQLVDISRGGLSVRMQICSGMPSDYQKLDLQAPKEKFSIAQIPYRTVSGTGLVGTALGSSVIVQRFGLAFQELNPGLGAKLDNFLENCTYGGECM